MPISRITLNPREIPERSPVLSDIGQFITYVNPTAILQYIWNTITFNWNNDDREYQNINPGYLTVLDEEEAATTGAYRYSLVSGFGDWDNDHFKISNDGDGDKLVAYNGFNFLIKPSRYVRIRSTNISDDDDWLENVFTVDVINRSLRVDTILYGEEDDTTSPAKSLCAEVDTTVSYVTTFRDDCAIPSDHEVGAGLTYL